MESDGSAEPPPVEEGEPLQEEEEEEEGTVTEKAKIGNYKRKHMRVREANRIAREQELKVQSWQEFSAGSALKAKKNLGEEEYNQLKDQYAEALEQKNTAAQDTILKLVIRKGTLTDTQVRNMFKVGAQRIARLRRESDLPQQPCDSLSHTHTPIMSRSV